jgi:DNA polymerase elongation subunit (family B)
VRILLLDIETAPNTAYVWGLWKQNVSVSQLTDSSFVMCWAAKWLGDGAVMYNDFRGGKKKMLREIHALLSKADAVIHYNGRRFDIPTLNKEFLEQGMKPPAGYKQIDLLDTAKKEFRFPSNKLEYVARALKLEGKRKHEGFELWVKCMAKDPDAWALMEDYNKQDVVVLENVYERFLPWIKSHPNVALHESLDGHSCPKCGSDKVQKRGFSFTSVSKYQRYQCGDCGAWSRERYRQKSTREMLTEATT